MARFNGIVGYGTPTEVVNGVWSEAIVERAYTGDILDETTSIVQTERVSKDIQLQQRISIIADAFALESFQSIKYVEWAGSLWEVNTAQVKRPRLILSLGGVYDGPRPTP